MHETTIRVRFDEVDVGGVVHHPRYLIYFEIARTAFLRDAGEPYSDTMSGGTHLAVIEAAATYRRPARYEDDLVVTTRLTEASGTRIRLEYEVLREGELLAAGHTRLASITEEGRPTRMPARLRALFDRLLEPGKPGE